MHERIKVSLSESGRRLMYIAATMNVVEIVIIFLVFKLFFQEN